MILPEDHLSEWTRFVELSEVEKNERIMQFTEH